MGMIGSGLFVTAPVAGFPPLEHDTNGALPEAGLTPAEQLHNLSAIPIFIGIPVATLVSAGSAVRRRDYRWAAHCVGSAIGIGGACGLFGAAFGGAPKLVRYGGLFQRISIATGLGWLSVLSLRALRLD
jgi:hypothetical protein